MRWAVPSKSCVSAPGPWCPDWTTEEGKTALGGYAFVLINFARLIVPARIALALAFAPWVDENIVKRFNPPDPADLPEDCVVEE